MSTRAVKKRNNLIRQLTDKGAKPHEEELVCLLCMLCAFAALREMLLLFQVLLHSFTSVRRRARPVF
jgi:hypothetical protein